VNSEEGVRELSKDGADGNPAFGEEGQEAGTSAAESPLERRPIAWVKHGTPFGPSTRLCTAADLGQVLKPFVCMEHEQVNPYERPGGRLRPFSGMAVLTLVLSGTVEFEDTTGNASRLGAGGVAWLMSGLGVWQAATRQSGAIARILRIGIALGASAEEAIPRSRYIVPSAVPEAGPVRVILGRTEGMAGALDEPEDINVLHVRLHRGQRWWHCPPLDHKIAWIAVDRGRLRVQHAQSNDIVQYGELAGFEESRGLLRFHAEEVTSFVVGSSRRHPHPLVFDRFSVHTTHEAMSRAKGEIARIGRGLLAQGRVP